MHINKYITIINIIRIRYVLVILDNIMNMY